MIDTKIFQLGATSIQVFVTDWKRDKITPMKFKCVIEHASHSPSAFTAERENALAAERECVEAFIAFFSKRPAKGIHDATKAMRPTSEPDPAPDKPLPPAKKVAKPKSDDFEY